MMVTFLLFKLNLSCVSVVLLPIQYRDSACPCSPPTHKVRSRLSQLQCPLSPRNQG